MAGDYVLLGRLCRHLKTGSLLIVLSPRRITRIFVVSDITTFLIQALGRSLTTIDNVNTVLTGSHISVRWASTAIGQLCLPRMRLSHIAYESIQKKEGVGDVKGIFRRWKAMVRRDLSVVRDWRACALVLSCIGILDGSGQYTARSRWLKDIKPEVRQCFTVSTSLHSSSQSLSISSSGRGNSSTKIG